MVISYNNLNYSGLTDTTCFDNLSNNVTVYVAGSSQHTQADSGFCPQAPRSTNLYELLPIQESPRKEVRWVKWDLAGDGRWIYFLPPTGQSGQLQASNFQWWPRPQTLYSFQKHFNSYIHNISMLWFRFQKGNIRIWRGPSYSCRSSCSHTNRKSFTLEFIYTSVKPSHNQVSARSFSFN